MRPRGEVRTLLHDALAQISPDGATGATFRQVLEVARPAIHAAGVEITPRQARVSLDNMLRAGEVVLAGYDKPAGSARWHAMFALPDKPPDEAPSDMMSGLVFVMRDWATR